MKIPSATLATSKGNSEGRRALQNLLGGSDAPSMEKNHFYYKPQHYTVVAQPSFHKQLIRTKGSGKG